MLNLFIFQSGTDLCLCHIHLLVESQEESEENHTNISPHFNLSSYVLTDVTVFVLCTLTYRDSMDSKHKLSEEHNIDSYHSYQLTYFLIS